MIDVKPGDSVMCFIHDLGRYEPNNDSKFIKDYFQSGFSSSSNLEICVVVAVVQVNERIYELDATYCFVVGGGTAAWLRDNMLVALDEIN